MKLNAQVTLVIASSFTHMALVSGLTCAGNFAACWKDNDDHYLGISLGEEIADWCSPVYSPRHLARNIRNALNEYTYLRNYRYFMSLLLAMGKKRFLFAKLYSTTLKSRPRVYLLYCMYLLLPGNKMNTRPGPVIEARTI